MNMSVRPDLVAAHEDSWAALGRPGSQWSGEQRAELAGTASAAFLTDNPLPPWVAPSTVASRAAGFHHAPPAAHDAIYRITCHAGTLTDTWYERVTAEIGELPYLELVAISCTVVAVQSFRRSLGHEPRLVPTPTAGEAHGRTAAATVRAELNWVPVAAPADQRAAVVQAFTALPDEHRQIWAMADAQYIPDLEMIDPHWTRGTLSRPQMELLATRVAQVRDCFF